MTAIEPFTVSVPDEAIADLRRRIARTRWAERETVDDWSQGTPLSALRELLDYWSGGYDWRRFETRLNGLGQFMTRIDGLDIHFIYVRSPHPDAVPLILTHGWPGSVAEFIDVIAPLADPSAHGGKAGDAFHVVVPSLPGYGSSGKPDSPGWGVERIAAAWSELMRRLGYERWFAQGGDWGGIVTTALGVLSPPGLAGIHTNMPLARPSREDRADDDPAVIEALEAGKAYKTTGVAYAQIQTTKPQTIGYGLVDSPVALAGWIYEKMHGWTDNQGKPEDALSRDAILDNISLYWFTASGASSARLYWESFGAIGKRGTVMLPAAVSTFPREITKAPRRWAERILTNIVYWNDCERGGHFAAWEEPDLFVEEVRRGFAIMR
jgi:pimeloyl-ACP methyl ester carboxylesterase